MVTDNNALTNPANRAATMPARIVRPMVAVLKEYTRKMTYRGIQPVFHPCLFGADRHREEPGLKTMAPAVSHRHEHIFRPCSPGAVITNQTRSHFETLSEVMAGKAELREVIDEALKRSKLNQTRAILFVMPVLETLNWTVTATA